MSKYKITLICYEDDSESNEEFSSYEDSLACARLMTTLATKCGWKRNRRSNKPLTYKELYYDLFKEGAIMLNPLVS